MFFIDANITWYEALILICFYGIYCIFMKFNLWIKSVICGKCRKDDVINEEELEGKNDLSNPPRNASPCPTVRQVQYILNCLSYYLR